MKAPFGSRIFVWLCTAAALSLAVPALSYLNEYTNQTPDHWDLNAFPVTYQVNPSVGSNVQGGSSSAIAVIQASFATWNNAPNASINVTYAGSSTLTKASFDGVNLICFVCNGDFSKDSTTLAVTTTTTSTSPGDDTKHGTASTFAGQIMDADILFNPATQWTTGGTPSDSQQDLQTVATHEIGHFLGLDHSGVVRAVMYPFAPALLTTLSYDDVAAISTIYPKSSPDVQTGTISGTITKTSGGGVFGAHVFADPVDGGASVFPGIRKTPIGAMTLNNGNYQIKGVPPGKYTVGVEPFDKPVSDGDVPNFASSFGRSAVDTSFTTRWH